MMPWVPLNGPCSLSTAQWTAGIAAGTPCDDNNQLTELLGATFTTPPFTEPYAISGPIDATIWMSSNATDAQIIATLSDVAPGNTSSAQITQGTLVASLRQLTTTKCSSIVDNCSVFGGDQLLEPWHPYTLASQTPLTPMQPTKLDIEIFPTSAVLEPGHSLRLTLTTADFPHELPTLPTLVNGAAAIDMIYLGPQYPSSIYLKNVSPML